MATVVATHSGPFHADDVLSWALLRTFLDPNATLVRSRDKNELDKADVVFDVGGLFDPAKQRFDHHQNEYTGALSSAGMVLNWLEQDNHVSAELATILRDRLVDYVDAVDNGRQTPDASVPCFSQLIGQLTAGCESMEDFDDGFRRAGMFAQAIVTSFATDLADRQASEAAVRAAMDHAQRIGSNLLVLDRYHRWKETYFSHGGIEHPTEFLVHPGVDGRWRSIAIPPVPNSFAQKRSFPEAWAGLRDDDLARVTAVKGARFCHKNRFIAVFDTREGTLDAMARFGLIVGPKPD
jgi:uncharacterized UPF0160 family protein